MILHPLTPSVYHSSRSFSLALVLSFSVYFFFSLHSWVRVIKLFVLYTQASGIDSTLRANYMRTGLSL